MYCDRLLAVFCRSIVDKIRKAHDQVLTKRPTFRPRLDIIKANARAETSIYIAKKVQLLQKVNRNVFQTKFKSI